MAEDGMLLNFALGEPVVRNNKFKGGNWRERLQAKRDAQRGGKRRSTDPNKVALPITRPGKHSTVTREQGADLTDPRPTKRRRDSDYTPSFSKHESRIHLQGQGSTHSKPNSGPREVISSLFSYNPEPTNIQEPEPSHDEKPALPSNAPLVDGIDTFTSLGLSPTIATHLLTKMNLKAPTAIQKASITQLVKEDSDAFMQSETGSGKTLAYLLPIVQRIMTLSELSKGQTQGVQDVAVHRDSGLFAIILAPTRELCKQISVVLERLLGCANYIVAGTVIGGEKKKSEKARLRKGLNILVATPGRLVDHLEHTKALSVGTVRWLVLDEGDRLMDLGFEEEIGKIVQALDQKKRKSSRQGLPERRTTVLCSATLKMNVQKLGEISLKDAVLIKGESEGQETSNESHDNGTDTAFLAPAQLKQSYLVTAAKLRLVTLTALLKRTFARKGSVMKAIVFMSCADSVEFHYKAFSRAPESTVETEEAATQQPDADDDNDKPTTAPSNVESDSIASSPLLSSPQNPITLYKLHGSLPQATRTSIVKHFANTTEPSLLIATDVASRGLDLPNLDLVIEYDPAFSSDDHLHRIGRTARLGRDGRAIIFLLPGKEEGYVEVLKKSYKSSAEADTTRNVTHMAADDVLKKGFSALAGVVPTAKSMKNSKVPESNASWDAKATEFQLEVERWVLGDAKIKEAAKRAFQSHVRAYATHIAAERKWFDIKELHLGHLAKAFGLRDPPGRVNVIGQGRAGGGKNERRRPTGDGATKGDGGQDGRGNPEATTDQDEAAKKMRDKIRAQRKMMMGGGADEFNIA
ncbi:hypothetical protein PV10_04977 [Exophiala mesophila]|uniref:ATP-dependent RNA helicase n=1 Tax=Exophiala mesophila TaxID=212818 RepID=A0A0D1ZIN4_EXOME|nr:uncharacterized protein PV10_04977 [Exophiala mesophila]KIV93789.1 hypothetical protein PV10_04977 [Exophiala mesophila]